MKDNLRVGWGACLPQDLIDLIKATKYDEVRFGDACELADYWRVRGIPTQVLIGPSFGEFLLEAMGLMNQQDRQQTRIYTIHKHMNPFNPLEKTLLFAATINKPKDGVAVLCGFGKKMIYKELNRRQQARTIKAMFQHVCRDLGDVFGVECAVCHVKTTNAATLNMWRHLAKQNWKGRIAIEIMDNPFMNGYKLVTLYVNKPIAE